MHRWRCGSVIAALTVRLWLPVTVHPGETGSDQQGNLRPTMRGIFQALTTVLPLSLDDETYQNDANRQRIRDALQSLASHANQLTQHGRKAPASFDFLRRSFHRDAQKTSELYESEHFEASRFVLHHLTDNCFLCHSRLPSSRSFTLGKRFLKEVPMTWMDSHERVRLAVAVRQFDTALEGYEALFRSPDHPAAQMDLMALFEDYMRIVIRVRRDFPRAIETLETFRQRPDVPRYLDAHLSAWLDALKALQTVTSQGNPLTHARTLIQQGQQRNRFLADRQGLVHFTLASGLLHRHVDSGSLSKPELAEAYYLLGVAESYIPRTSWISETELFLEMAVRLAPASQYGNQAFAFLEEYLIMGFTGSSGLHLPSDIQKRLDDLRALVDGPAAKQ